MLEGDVLGRIAAIRARAGLLMPSTESIPEPRSELQTRNRVSSSLQTYHRRNTDMSQSNHHSAARTYRVRVGYTHGPVAPTPHLPS
jgi:hypothetical protein